MGFFPDGVVQRGQQSSISVRGSTTALLSAVRALKPSTKQAMFAAASQGLIARRTWNGCAFNKAGKVVGKGVHSHEEAAMAFGESTENVRRFITAWDLLAGTDTEATKYLIECLQDVGTHTPTGGPNNAQRIFRGYVYKSEATKFAEQLESGELTVEMIPGCKEMGELLSSCAAS